MGEQATGEWIVRRKLKLEHRFGRKSYPWVVLGTPKSLNMEYVWLNPSQYDRNKRMLRFPSPQSAKKFVEERSLEEEKYDYLIARNDLLP